MTPATGPATTGAAAALDGTAVSPLVTRARDLRRRLRASDGPLAMSPIGTVPILWNNVDIEELRLGTDAFTILDEIARTGYDGTQLGLGFPDGEALRTALAERDLHLAEVYASLPATIDGPSADALDLALERLRLLVAGGGDVLCVALDLSAGRIETAGRAHDAATPRLTEAGWSRLTVVLHDLGRATLDTGARMAFHPHAGTFVETPDEVATLMTSTDPELVPLCLDVGHWLVGGGDPVAAIDAFGERVTHVHLKDVDPEVLGRLWDGELSGFTEAIRARLFTELGAGSLDLDGCLAALAANGYCGWLMVEQDSGWSPPSESAAIGRRVLAASLHRMAAAAQGGR
jgi:inosose dehydratase